MSLSRLAVAAVLAAFAVALYKAWPLVRVLWLFRTGLRDLETRLEARVEAGRRPDEALVDQIAARDETERWAAARTLRDRGVTSPACIMRLRELLDARRSDVRAAAATALGGAGQLAGPHVPRMVAVLRDAKVEAQAEILESLTHVGGLPKDGVALVVDLLRGSPSDEVRASAAEVLATLRVDGKVVVDALCASLRTDPWVSVRMWCAVALGWLPPDEAGTRALEHARDQDHDDESSIRTTVEEALERRARFGVRAEETPEQRASAVAFIPGDALFEWNFGVCTFVGIGEQRDHRGFHRRTLRVELESGVVVDLPLACIGLKRLATKEEARAIVDAYFASPAALEPNDGAPSCRLPEILAELGRDEPAPWADAELERIVRELAHVLGRTEADLRAQLAARHPSIAARIEAGVDPEASPPTG